MMQHEIEEQIQQFFVERLDVDPDKIKPEAHLYDELGIDSIDAVDLIVQMTELTGKRIAPEEFKEVRTMGDVTGLLRTQLAKC